MDDVIGTALRAGNKTEAMRVSRQLRALKDEIATQNDDYAEVLRGQRDLFEQEDAVEIGRTVLGKLGNKPRQMLKLVKGMNENQRLSARIGMIDQLINAETKGDPVERIMSFMRTDQQREVLEFAFGGKEPLKSFTKWLKAESIAKDTDRVLVPGRTSDTQRFKMAADDGDGGVADAAIGATKGFAFGGGVGLAGNLMQRLDNLVHGTSKYQHNELARILMSKGKDLEEGIKVMAAFAKNRAGFNQKMARYAGKAFQQPITSTIVGEDNAI
jgi:hypothetical protein